MISTEESVIMTIRGRTIRIVSMLCLSFFMSRIIYAQKTLLSEQEAVLLGKEVRYDSLQTVHVQRLEEAEALARRIDLTRLKETLSASEHRTLQKQLLESQRLEALVRELESLIDDAERSFRLAVHEYTRKIQNEIVLTIEQMERRDDSGDLERLQMLLQKRTLWETRLAPPSLRGQRTLQVQTQAWDTPRTLELKGDLLLDQEEVLRNEIATVETRLRSLEEEERIRRKVAELTRDIHLFDEREELMGKGIENQTRSLSLETFDIQDRNIPGLPGLSSTRAYYEEIQLALSGPTPRSPDELNTWIIQLKQYRNLIVARADSLGQRASWFYHEAETRRE